MQGYYPKVVIGSLAIIPSIIILFALLFLIGCEGLQQVILQPDKEMPEVEEMAEAEDMFPAFSDFTAALDAEDDTRIQQLLAQAPRLTAGLKLPRDTFGADPISSIVIAHNDQGRGVVIAIRIFEHEKEIKLGDQIHFVKQGDLWVLSVYNL